ncbi:K P-type ATPase (mediates high-affinity potassium or sodium uptake) [Fusarium napiforme]|uniref:K P-type ATPase (Mediates high-affinity potassium or sodium uptake) n=1 Tax=Fusarium napiforme TaxID=42672 RepID=A0A8H5IPV0_9HYPO|nr:K P-type ATPase (mediates high-affinity potassium or sodium uptake) [Fusarium napiforme]
MEYFPFERLPMELKIKIIRFAIPSTPARFVKNHFQGYLVSGSAHEEEEELRRICASCPEIKAICDQIRYFVINVPVPWYLSKIPEEEMPKSSQQAGLPIRRMVYWTSKPWISTEAQVGSVPSDARETFSQLPFDSSLPIWQYTPMLKAFTLVIDKCDWSWHIESFQQYGPGTSARTNIHEAEDDRFINSASLRLQSDTGIRWMLDPTRTLHYRYPGDPLASFPSGFWPYTPMIGFHGYSRGSRSQGGKWAGFRYWTETKKIEFRPLSWPEVKDAMEDDQRDQRWHHEFIARLWINRPGEPVDAEQSQYGWIEVKAPEKGDASWIEQVATTWKMVRYTLMRMDEASRIDWRFGNE